MPQTSALEFVAEICLYGVASTGFGYIARTAAGRMVGDGTPNKANSLTDAMWTAVLDLGLLGVSRGRARVFEPSGLRVATLELGAPVYFGELVFEAAPVYVISADAIAAAGSEVE